MAQRAHKFCSRGPSHWWHRELTSFVPEAPLIDVLSKRELKSFNSETLLREMERFFVNILTEQSLEDNTTPRLQSTRVYRPDSLFSYSSMTYPKESSQRPLSLMSHPRERSIQERAHKFVSEGSLIDGTSKRVLHPRERSQICLWGFSHWWHIQDGAPSKRELTNCFRGFTHWWHIQERAPSKRELTNLFQRVLTFVLERAHKSVSEGSLIDGTSKRVLHPKESSQICFKGPTNCWHFQERAK